MRRLLIHTLVVLLILVLGASPFISAAIAGSIANANGCDLHEGFVNPCVINGVDRGSELYTWAMLAWFGIATVPIALGAAFIYIAIVVILWLIGRQQRRRRAQQTAEATSPPL
jgi:hypothetical protein